MGKSQEEQLRSERALPRGIDVVLVPPQLRSAVHGNRGSLWRKPVLRVSLSNVNNLELAGSTYFVGIAANTCD